MATARFPFSCDWLTKTSSRTGATSSRSTNAKGRLATPEEFGQIILEVVDANRDALRAERANAQVTGRRLIASVQLIKALGGGWTERTALSVRH